MVGSYSGGKTHYGFSRRLQHIARKAIIDFGMASGPKSQDGVEEKAVSIDFGRAVGLSDRCIEELGAKGIYSS